MGWFNHHLAGDDQNHRKTNHFFEEIGGGETLHPRAEQRSSGWMGITGRGKRYTRHNLKEILEMEKNIGCFLFVLTADNSPE